jgi:CHASE1-domain containing sensor protein
LGLLATLAASMAAWEQKRSNDQMRFGARTETLQNTIAERFDRCLDLMRGEGGLFVASQEVEPDEWRRYAASLDLKANFPALRALGYAENVSASELPALIQRNRLFEAGGEGGAEFHVWPADSRERHYVVTMVEPIERNRIALGFDLASDPVRREAADKAADTGQPTMTRRLRLVQAPELPGVLLFLPIYDRSHPTTDVAGRRGALLGWVYGAFVLDELLTDIRRSAGEGVAFELLDGPVVSPETRLAGVPPAAGRERSIARCGYEREVRLVRCNQIWTVRFHSTEAFRNGNWFAAPGHLAAAALGLCISVLAFMVLRTVGATRARAESMAQRMTSELRLLNWAMESANDGVFILDASRPDWPILYTNPAFRKMRALSAERHLGRETLSIIGGKPGQTALSGVRAELKPGAQPCGGARVAPGRHPVLGRIQRGAPAQRPGRDHALRGHRRGCDGAPAGRGETEPGLPGAGP